MKINLLSTIVTLALGACGGPNSQSELQSDSPAESGKRIYEAKNGDCNKGTSAERYWGCKEFNTTISAPAITRVESAALSSVVVRYHYQFAFTCKTASSLHATVKQGDYSWVIPATTGGTTEVIADVAVGASADLTLTIPKHTSSIDRECHIALVAATAIPNIDSLKVVRKDLALDLELYTSVYQKAAVDTTLLSVGKVASDTLVILEPHLEKLSAAFVSAESTKSASKIGGIAADARCKSLRDAFSVGGQVEDGEQIQNNFWKLQADEAKRAAIKKCLATDGVIRQGQLKQTLLTTNSCTKDQENCTSTMNSIKEEAEKKQAAVKRDLESLKSFLDGEKLRLTGAAEKFESEANSLLLEIKNNQ